jgi:integrase
VASKSTGQRNLEDAIVAAEGMLRAGGKKPTAADARLSDEEFEALQRAHFDRKKDPAARARAQKTLHDCLDAIHAFRQITGLNPITVATPDDCAAFQRKALTLPKNWRKKYPRSKKEVPAISANTVLKWSRALQAAFDRANRNAGRKSVRGVLHESKLLNENPWKQFTWIEGAERPIRQFGGSELLSLLDHLEARWPDVTVAPLLAKVYLWSWARRIEVTGLRWSSLKIVGSEYHFEIIGKWGVEKWFRLPSSLYRELIQVRTESPYVFAAYGDQLRGHYLRAQRNREARLVLNEFKPVNLADWFHQQIVAWSKGHALGHATVHIFRKTSLQYARSGEDVNRDIATDARLSEGVMMTNYVKETDVQMRQRSNRMFRRILAGLEPAVARRYGYDQEKVTLRDQIRQAAAAEDWDTVASLTAKARKSPLTRTG